MFDFSKLLVYQKSLSLFFRVKETHPFVDADQIPCAVYNSFECDVGHHVDSKMFSSFEAHHLNDTLHEYVEQGKKNPSVNE